MRGHTDGNGDARIDDALATIRRGVEQLSLAVRARDEPSSEHVLLSRADVARRLCVPEAWVARRARRGALPFARRLGRKIVYDRAGLDAYIESLGTDR
jgi:predicted DNA-binding transcriptional regulator AlpA